MQALLSLIYSHSALQRYNPSLLERMKAPSSSFAPNTSRDRYHLSLIWHFEACQACKFWELKQDQWVGFILIYWEFSVSYVLDELGQLRIISKFSKRWTPRSLDEVSTERGEGGRNSSDIMARGSKPPHKDETVALSGKHLCNNTNVLMVCCTLAAALTNNQVLIIYLTLERQRAKA